MKSHWKMHKGVRLFYLDLSGFGRDDQGIMAECDLADAVIMAEPENSVRLLTDVHHSVGVSMEIVKYLQMSTERTNPYVIRAAVVGLTGAKLQILQLVNRFSKRPIVPFEDLESAMDYLVADLAFR